MKKNVQQTIALEGFYPGGDFNPNFIALMGFGGIFEIEIKITSSGGGSVVQQEEEKDVTITIRLKLVSGKTPKLFSKTFVLSSSSSSTENFKSSILFRVKQLLVKKIISIFVKPISIKTIPSSLKIKGKKL